MLRWGLFFFFTLSVICCGFFLQTNVLILICFGQKHLLKHLAWWSYFPNQKAWMNGESLSRAKKMPLRCTTLPEQDWLLLLRRQRGDMIRNRRRTSTPTALCGRQFKMSQASKAGAPPLCVYVLHIYTVFDPLNKASAVKFTPDRWR